MVLVVVVVAAIAARRCAHEAVLVLAGWGVSGRHQPGTRAVCLAGAEAVVVGADLGMVVVVVVVVDIVEEVASTRREGSIEDSFEDLARPCVLP